MEVTGANRTCVVEENPSDLNIPDIDGPLYAMMCNNIGLFSVPDGYPSFNASFTPPISWLDLGNNAISKIENGSFMAANLTASDVHWLSLQNNLISYIYSGAFEALHSLMYLNLSFNKLEWKSSFGAWVFKPLTSLMWLDLKANRFKNLKDFDEELLLSKNLTGLCISPLSSNFSFGPKFRQFRNFSTLRLSGTAVGDCDIDVVLNDTFQHVMQIKHLALSNCNVRKIEGDAFKPLRSLVDLDISYNQRLKLEGMNLALHGLRNSSTLRELNASQLYSPYGLGLVLKAEHLENLNTLNGLETLHLDNNKIEVLEEEIFTPKFLLPSSLRNLTVSGNRFSYDIYTRYLYMAKNITKIDISRQHIGFDPFFGGYETHYVTTSNDLVPNGHQNSKSGISVYTSNKYSETACNCSVFSNSICLPPDVKEVLWYKSFLYLSVPPVTICNADRLESLDLSFNLIFNWDGPVFGLQNVKYLTLSKNFCNHISENFFRNFTGLSNLDISMNNLSRVLDPKVNAFANKIFANQKKMKYLDMSYNGLYTLPEDIFVATKQLECLDLSNNNLDDWTVKLTSTMFKRLNLQGNKLRTLPEFLRKFLDDSSKRHDVMVELAYNKIDCSQCESLPFLKWMVKTKVKIYFSPNESCLVNEKDENMSKQKYVQNIVRILENNVCNKRLWLTWSIAGSAGLLGCIVTSIVCATIYKSRWKLRYLYYSRRRRYTHEGFEHLFSRDAYVSYAKGKAKLIYDTVVPALEDQHCLHLWVADRDSLPGVSIAENIVYGICNSRKTVFLIDEEFLNDTWCDYDMNMALVESIETKRSAIIIVLMDNISVERIPIHIIRFLKHEPSLEYPAQNENLEIFWRSLVTEIHKTD